MVRETTTEIDLLNQTKILKVNSKSESALKSAQQERFSLEKKTREEARFKEDSIKADKLAESKLKNQQELQSLAEEISRLSSEYYQLLPKVS